MNPSSTSAVLFTHIIYYYHELAALGLVVAHGFSLVAVSWGSSLVVVVRLLIMVAFLVAEHGF